MWVLFGRQSKKREREQKKEKEREEEERGKVTNNKTTKGEKREDVARRGKFGTKPWKWYSASSTLVWLSPGQQPQLQQRSLVQENFREMASSSASRVEGGAFHLSSKTVGLHSQKSHKPLHLLLYNRGGGCLELFRNSLCGGGGVSYHFSITHPSARPLLLPHCITVKAPSTYQALWLNIHGF